MYKEFFNFDANTIFSFSFNKPCWDISLFFSKIFFKKKERKIKIIVEHLENGIRNHGNLSPIPKIGEPFRKLVPHPLLRYPCLVLDFTLDPTNCFPRNEIKVSSIRGEHTWRTKSALPVDRLPGRKIRRGLHPFRKIFWRDSTRSRRINIITRVFWRFFARFLPCFLATVNKRAGNNPAEGIG